jgi:hypothetical protein
LTLSYSRAFQKGFFFKTLKTEPALYKMVLIPRLCYKSSGLSLSMRETEELEKPIRKLLKSKLSLPRCISNSVLFSSNGYSLPKILDKIDGQEITNMMVWLNSDELVGDLPTS